MRISGLRCTIQLEDGKSLSEEAVKKAVVAKGLAFVDMSTVEVAVPKAIYKITKTGDG